MSTEALRAKQLSTSRMSGGGGVTPTQSIVRRGAHIPDKSHIRDVTRRAPREVHPGGDIQIIRRPSCSDTPGATNFLLGVTTSARPRRGVDPRPPSLETRRGCSAPARGERYYYRRRQAKGEGRCANCDAITNGPKWVSAACVCVCVCVGGVRSPASPILTMIPPIKCSHGQTGDRSRAQAISCANKEPGCRNGEEGGWQESIRGRKARA